MKEKKLLRKLLELAREESSRCVSLYDRPSCSNIADKLNIDIQLVLTRCKYLHDCGYITMDRTLLDQSDWKLEGITDVGLYELRPLYKKHKFWSMVFSAITAIGVLSTFIFNWLDR